MNKVVEMCEAVTVYYFSFFNDFVVICHPHMVLFSLAALRQGAAPRPVQQFPEANDFLYWLVGAESERPHATWDYGVPCHLWPFAGIIVKMAQQTRDCSSGHFVTSNEAARYMAIQPVSPWFSSGSSL